MEPRRIGDSSQANSTTPLGSCSAKAMAQLPLDRKTRPDYGAFNRSLKRTR
jgi:hypothetical protein